MYQKEENCPVGELSINGKCKCGDSKSCFGNQKGPICDLDLNQCVCGEGVPKCQDNEYCIFGKCAGKITFLLHRFYRFYRKLR